MLTSQQQHELRRLDELIHDLSNQVQIVLGAEAMVSTPCPFHQELHEELTRLVTIVQQIKKDLSDRSIIMSFQTITVDELVRIVKEEIRDIDLRTSLTPSIHLNLSDRDLQKKVIYSSHGADRLISNLISNWLQAQAEHVHFTIYVDHRFQAAILEMADDGHGMNASTLAKTRTGPMPGEGEKGKGCQIIRKLCAQRGCTISWESIEHIGTKTTLRYPLADSQET
jgi:signal transduction histidine kinase